LLRAPPCRGRGEATEGPLAAVDRNSLEHARRSLENGLLFRGLVAVEKDALLSRARVRRFDAGDVIFLMGTPGDSMMAVLSGDVRISVPSPGGREIVLAILHENEHFGEIAMLDGKERTADARALTPCTLATLERRDALAFLERHPGAWVRLVEVLCERMRATDEHIAEIALLQLPVRLAKAVLRFGNLQQVAAPAIQLSQRELGNLVGAARESVNKCLREWQRNGIVRVEGSAITIADRAALERLADQD
jgi:CRP/FNR family transcriptional regulator, cyclic AMP receptor protein